MNKKLFKWTSLLLGLVLEIAYIMYLTIQAVMVNLDSTIYLLLLTLASSIIHVIVISVITIKVTDIIEDMMKS